MRIRAQEYLSFEQRNRGQCLELLRTRCLTIANGDEASPQDAPNPIPPIDLDHHPFTAAVGPSPTPAARAVTVIFLVPRLVNDGRQLGAASPVAGWGLRASLGLLVSQAH